MTKEQLLNEAMALNAEERNELAEELLQSIGEGELSVEQRAEVRRRAEQLDRGEVESIDGDQVMREARERVRRVRGA